MPRSRGCILRSAAIVPQTAPRYVTSVARRNSSGVVSPTGAKTVVIALFTQTSSGPKRSSICPAASSTASASATSSGSTSASPPSSSTSVAVARSRSSPRAINPMRAPSRAKRRTVARPTPAEAPVTAITFIALRTTRVGDPKNAGATGSSSARRHRAPRRSASHPRRDRSRRADFSGRRARRPTGPGRIVRPAKAQL